MGSTSKEGVHLVKWEKNYTPKRFRVWGQKKVFWFGQALTMKSLWRGLFGKGPWNELFKQNT